FSDAAWQENQLFDFIKQSYLLSARWVQSTVHSVEGLDQKTAKKVDFYTRQFVDAMAPSNFVMTNPEVLRKTLESGGENLVKGLENLLTDLERGKGKLQIKMTDPEAFEVGKNFDDYMLEGPLAALDAIEKATGEKQINAVGYCLGGTLLACTLAYMAVKKIDRIASATFLTTMVDFTEPGELGVFIDEEQLQ